MLYEIPSKSIKGTFHQVTNTDNSWKCDCIGFKQNQDCRHISLAKAELLGKKSVNTRFVKISSRIEIPHDLKLGEDVSFKIDGSVVKIDYSDLQDGTYDKVFHVKPVIGEKI